MRLKHALSSTLVAAVLLTACSGDDDTGDSSTTSAPVTESAQSSTTTTSGATVTTVEATTAPNTTEPPTTAAATTTTTLPVNEQVRSAMLGYYDFYWRCLRSPTDCDPLVVTVPDSDAFRALTTTRNDLVAGHYYVGAEDVGYMVITAIEPGGDHTLVTTCWWSTAWLYFQPPVAGAAPTVQNNTPSSGYEVFQFVQGADQVWRVRRSDLRGDDSAENVCPPNS